MERVLNGLERGRTGMLGNVGSLADEGTAWQDGMKLQAEGRPGLAGLTGAWSFFIIHLKRAEHHRIRARLGRIGRAGGVRRFRLRPRGNQPNQGGEESMPQRAAGLRTNCKKIRQDV